MMSKQQMLFIPKIKAHTTEEIITAILRQASKYSPLPPETIAAEIKKRENSGITTVGEGVFIPHARLTGQDELVIAIATLEYPVDAPDSPDGKPLEFVCLLLIPEAEPLSALKVMSCFALGMRDMNLRNRLRDTKDLKEAEPLMTFLAPEEHSTLTAAEIMAPCTHYLEAKMSLKDATRQMTQWERDIVPVLRGNILLGEIACEELFKIGILEFFTQLKSVGFIRHFDPFANYFRMEAAACVVDVMQPAQGMVSPEATMIEVVFMMVVRKVRMLYVVNENRELLGIIDQSLLLERIINI